jgi:SAM-dependent methyltransferase
MVAGEFMKLNLGCCNHPLDGYVNVDIVQYPHVGALCDLNVFPYPFGDNSASEILCNGIIEHLRDPSASIRECHRILKQGGVLKIIVPHITNLKALGDLEHYKGYALNTFDKFLCRPYFLPDRPLFKTISKRIIYIGQGNGTMQNICYYATLPIEFFINTFPTLYERLLWPFLGCASAVEWIGEKV